MDALADGWRRLRWLAIAFHSHRPRIGFGAVGLTGGFLCLMTRTPGGYTDPQHDHLADRPGSYDDDAKTDEGTRSNRRPIETT